MSDNNYTVEKQGEWEIHRLRLPAKDVDMDYFRAAFNEDTGEFWFEMKVKPSDHKIGDGPNVFPTQPAVSPLLNWEDWMGAAE